MASRFFVLCATLAVGAPASAWAATDDDGLLQLLGARSESGTACKRAVTEAVERERPSVRSDREAARLTCDDDERRPANAAANSRVPTDTELRRFRALNATPSEYTSRVTGNFKGTTGEIIQWAAHKWGVDEDVMRAAAVMESHWDQGTQGDCRPRCVSFGLFQIKSTASRGTFPLSRESTAFNADYFGMTMRYYYDGRGRWLNRRCCRTRVRYRSGDLWGSLGAWFAGRWYSVGARRYAEGVTEHLHRRTWADPGF